MWEDINTMTIEQKQPTYAHMSGSFIKYWERIKSYNFTDECRKGLLPLDYFRTPSKFFGIHSE